MPTENQELVINEFYFLLTKEGYFLKTKCEEDFDVVCSWDSKPLFAGTIKNNQWLHYKIGSTWHKKQITRLPNAKSSDETIWYDVETLDDNFSSNISQVKFGGKQKEVIAEPL